MSLYHSVKRTWILCVICISLSLQAETLNGYNINWSFLPKLSEGLLQSAASLKPKLIRYPGGTVSKTWDWKTGKTSKRKRDVAHPLIDLRQMARATGAEVIFVLNTISSSLEDQVEMLKTARAMGVPVRYIEMGNEHYLGKGGNLDDSGKHQDNVKTFPTGKAYAQLVNRWAGVLKQAFPGVKIGTTMLGRKARGTSRQRNWNHDILSVIDKRLFDAYIYHVYVHTRRDPVATQAQQYAVVQKRIRDLKEVMIKDKSKEIWVSEYGIHDADEERVVAMTSMLADAIESFADIATPQVLYTRSKRTFFSLLKKPDAVGLTKLGKMFQKRAK